MLELLQSVSGEGTVAAASFESSDEAREELAVQVQLHSGAHRQPHPVRSQKEAINLCCMDDK